MPFHHGVEVVEAASGTRPIRTVSTAVIGFVATAADADAAAFPLNTPVLVTDINDAISKAGTDGTLRNTLVAIRDQVRTIVHVVRVEAGADSAGTDANVIGSADGDSRTGLQALLDCENLLGTRPRILGAPGLDTQAVTTAMVTVAQKLNAFAYAGAENAGTGTADAIGYRANFEARELMLIWPAVQAVDAEGAPHPVSAAAYALGLRARIDQEIGWHRSISNNAINGIVGTAHPVSFDMQSNATDAGILNAADVSTVIRNNGFRIWGNRTCAGEAAPFYVFETAVRSAQVLRDTIAEGLTWAIDKPLRPGLVKDIVSTINQKIGLMVANGYLIGGRAWYDPDKNPSASLAEGKLVIDYDFTPVPPLEGLRLNQTITDSYFASFDQVAAAA